MTFVPRLAFLAEVLISSWRSNFYSQKGSFSGLLLLDLCHSLAVAMLGSGVSKSCSFPVIKLHAIAGNIEVSKRCLLLVELWRQACGLLQSAAHIEGLAIGSWGQGRVRLET